MVDKHLLRFAIRDRGVGIDRKFLSQIGKKFFRVPTGDVHNAKGFGLGLHYVNQVVRAHDWKLDIQSELGQGTNISIDMKR